MSSYVSLAPYYDELTWDVPYRDFADFYEVLFKRYGVAPRLLLDLACGTGTLTLELARRGYEMIGVDASPDMLSLAMEKASQAELATPPIFLNQTMEELDLYGTVDAAICSLDGMNYIPAEALGRVFDRLRLFIEPGGVFLFDVNTPRKLEDLNGQIFVDETSDVFCVWRAELEPNRSALHYGMDIFARNDDGGYRRGGEEHVEYLHEYSRLQEELSQHGFGEIRAYAELLDEAPGLDEQRIFIAARRL